MPLRGDLASAVAQSHSRALNGSGWLKSQLQNGFQFCCVLRTQHAVPIPRCVRNVSKRAYRTWRLKDQQSLCSFYRTVPRDGPADASQRRD